MFHLDKGLNPYTGTTGSDRASSWWYLAGLFLALILAAWVMATFGLLGGFGLLALPFLLIYGYFFFRFPVIGLYTAIAMGFILLGLARYVRDLPVGMAMDGILVFSFIALFFNRFYRKIDWKPANRDITWLAMIWFIFTLMQLFNPEAASREAWLVGFRGLGLYMMLIVPLALLQITNRKQIDVILYIWAIFSILATIKGVMQITVGPDRFEKAWLDGGGAITHIIFGKLRAFSFMSDAGQFGANQAYSGIVFGILAIFTPNRKQQLFFIAVSLLAFYGMFISGTRGAISVPLAGLALFSLLRKNKFIMVSGFLLLVLVYAFFKFTYIGQGNQHIRRMRSAFDPNDPSLQVRLENQKKLRVYLATRPLGGGIGHAGVKAQRFLPNSFLANVATDSWYVLIWAETGIIGLIIHLFILIYILTRGSFIIMFRLKDPELKILMSALLSGMAGILVASYGNAVVGTMPTSILIYTSMALVLNSKQLDSNSPVSTDNPS